MPLSPSMQANFNGFTFVDETTMDEHFMFDHNNDKHWDWDRDRGASLPRSNNDLSSLQRDL